MDSGTTRPAYLKAGGFWYNTNDGYVYMFDGTNDKIVIIGDAPNDGNAWVRMNNSWGLLDPGGGTVTPPTPGTDPSPQPPVPQPPPGGQVPIPPPDSVLLKVDFGHTTVLSEQQKHRNDKR